MIKVSLKIDQREYRRVVIRGWRKTMVPLFKDIARTMRALMRAPKHGKFYGSHQASKPGEAPAVFTGFLIGTIGRPQIDDGVIRLEISDPKARLLDPQIGDPANTRVEPRPFVQPSIDGAVARAREGGTVAGIL